MFRAELIEQFPSRHGTMMQKRDRLFSRIGAGDRIFPGAAHSPYTLFSRVSRQGLVSCFRLLQFSGMPGKDGLPSTSQMVGCKFFVGRDRQRTGGQRRSASQPFHSHLRSVGHEFQPTHLARGSGAHRSRQVHCRSTCQGGQVGGRHQRSRRERSSSQFFEGSSPRRAGAVSGVPRGPAHRGDSRIRRASEEAHPGSPRRGDQTSGSCRCSCY